MSNDTASISGQLFSQLYLERGSPASDSIRMRRRISALFDELDIGGLNRVSVAARLKADLGIIVPVGVSSYMYSKFFETCELRDLLDSITVIWRIANRYTSDFTAKRWVGNISNIFKEENIGYTIDSLGGVHFAVDTEFEHNRSSTIAGLTDSRYGAVLELFQNSHKALDQVPPNNKDAIRYMFGSIENLFRMMFPRAPRLTASLLKEHLEPLIQSRLSKDSTATSVSQNMLAGLCDWINGVHYYRHEQGKEEPVQPPLALTIMIVSSGTAYLRWLADFDKTTT